MQSSNCQLTVDMTIIQNNLRLFTQAMGHIMVMVKANAYGTDPVLLVKYLQLEQWKNIPFVGVSHVSEGIKLREANIALPIFVISAPPYMAEQVAAHQLTVAVSTLQEVEALNRAAKKCGFKLSVHLHLDTGMNRMGISLKEAWNLYAGIHNAPYLHLEGIMTHFAAADSPSFDSFTERQIEVFKAFLDSLPSLPQWIHAANSAGAARFSLPFCNLARIGLGIMGYGYCLEGVRPVFHFSTQIVSISLRSKGEHVSYHCTYTIPQDKARIGVIAVGYYDGLHRNLSGKGYVLIHGKKAPMIGLICMDFMMVDLTEIPEAEVGDSATIFGEGLSPELVSYWKNSDVRELLVNLSSRVTRHWIQSPHLSLSKRACIAKSV